VPRLYQSRLAVRSFCSQFSYVCAPLDIRVQNRESGAPRLTSVVTAPEYHERRHITNTNAKRKATGALDAKAALFTGGNTGIGPATAKLLVKEGAYVFITGRWQAELDQAVSLVGKNVTAVQGDVSNLEDLDRLYETVRKVKGYRAHGTTRVDFPVDGDTASSSRASRQRFWYQTGAARGREGREQ
jgi:hypothetical protein